MVVIALQRSTDLGGYSLGVKSGWSDRLQPAGAVSQSPVGVAAAFQLYDAVDIRNSISQIVDLYYRALNTSLDYYFYETDPTTGRPLPVSLSITSFATSVDRLFDVATPFSGETATREYLLTAADDLGPFSSAASNASAPTDISPAALALIRTLQSASLKFSLQNYQFSVIERTCRLWRFRIDYDFSDRSRMRMSIDESVEICNPSAAFNVPHRSIYIAILIFATLLQFFLVRAVIKSINAFNAIRHQSMAAKRLSVSVNDKTKAQPSHHHHGPDLGHHVHTQVLSMLDFDDLTWSEKLRFFNVWFVILSVGNASVIICIAARMIITNFPPFEFLLAFGALLIWASLVQYLESFASFYSLVHTFRAATPQLIRFVLGVVPLAVAYVLFGISYFAEVTESFGSIDRATNSLFSMLNGDALHDFFDALAPRDLVVSRIYLYSFISLFIYTVFNMFLSIVTQAFALNKLLSPIPFDSHNDQAAVDLELKVRNHRFHVHLHGVEASVVPDRIDQMVAAVDASLASSSSGASNDSADASSRKVSFYDDAANGSVLVAGSSTGGLEQRASASTMSGAGVGGHRSSLRAATSQFPSEDVPASSYHGHGRSAIDRLQLGTAGDSGTRAYLIDMLLQQPPLEVIMAEAEAGVDFDYPSDDEAEQPRQQRDDIGTGHPETQRRSSSRPLHAVPLLAAPQRSSLTTLLDGIANTSALAPLSPSDNSAWRAKHVPSDEFSSFVSMTPPQASALSMALLAPEVEAVDARCQDLIVPAAPIVMDLREPHSISDLMQSIGAMQRACALSVSRGVRIGAASFFQQQMSQTGVPFVAPQPRLQAPHDAECYPCGFADCLDCRLRALHERAFADTKRELEELARHFFAMPVNAL